jgi:probable rRNA maturation factor
MMNETDPVLDLEVQCIAEGEGIPTRQAFYAWALAAMTSVELPVEMVIRVVDEAESRQLNNQYRGKDTSTNVLSFPFEAPAGIASSHLGDLVICAPVVKREARAQNKKEIDHWAHMVVHGVLHLQGYDHQTDEQAEQMERLEKKILEGFGIRDPYVMKDFAV